MPERNGAFKALIGDTQAAAYVRWGVLIFSIGVTWANLKGDVKDIARDQERNAASQRVINEKFQAFIDGTTERNENLAGWYERLYQNEKDVAELQYQVEQLMNRPRVRQSSYQSLPIIRNRALPVPIWRRDPRRNPTNP